MLEIDRVRGVLKHGPRVLPFNSKMSMLLQLEQLMEQLKIKRSNAQKQIEDAIDAMTNFKADVKKCQARQNTFKPYRRHGTWDDHDFEDAPPPVSAGRAPVAAGYVYDDADYAYDDTYDELAKRVYCKKEYTVRPKSSKVHRKRGKRDYHDDDDAYGDFRKRVHSKNKDKTKASPVRVFVEDQDGIRTPAKGRNKTKTRLFRAFKTHESWHEEDDEDDIGRVESFSDVEDRIHDYEVALDRIEEAQEDIMMCEQHIMSLKSLYKVTKARVTAIAMMTHPRLNADSPCSELKPEILRCIMQHL